MAVSVVLHRVENYDAWHKVYESATEIQKAGGVTAESVHRMAGDPNNVLVIHHFDTVAQAQAFFENPDLRDAMIKGGVKGEPRIEIFE